MDLIQFLRSLGHSFWDGVRRNKLPACLSLAAVVLTTTLAVTSDYDERPRYRKLILPEIEKAETQFFDVMDEADRQNREPLRMLYFIEAHRRAKSALKTIRSEYPLTPAGRKAQAELVRYYELVDEELAIIRTEMSNRDSYDYVGEWKDSNTELLPIRQRWLDWVNGAARPQ